MAMDLKWLLSADDNASPAFKQVQTAGTEAAAGITGAFDGLLAKFELLPAAIGAMAAIAGGLGFKSVIDDTVNWDLSINKLSNTLGVSLGDASAFGVALNAIGVDQDTAQTAALKLSKTMTTNSGIFDQLGVSIKNSNGSYRDSISVMMEVNQKLANLPAGFDRNTVAMQLYSRSWADVQSLLKLTPQVMDDAKEATDNLGLTVDAQGVQQAKAYKMAMNELHEAAEAIKIKLGAELLPIVLDIAQGMEGPAATAVHLFGDGLKAARDNALLLELGLGAMVAPAIMGGLSTLVGSIGLVTTAWEAMTIAAAANPVGAALILGGGAVYFGLKAIAAPGENAATTQLQADQKSLGASTEQLNAKLKTLGFSSWQEFDKASKAGKVVFDEMSSTWKMKDTLPTGPSDKDQLTLLDKQLAAYKTSAERQSAVAKEQVGIQETVLKEQYNQGLISTDDYYNQLIQDATNSAQQRLDIAQEYLAKEQNVMAFVTKTFGQGSTEYQSEKAKEENAVKGVQDAELAYGKTYLSVTDQKLKALQMLQDAYAKLNEQVLQASGDYVAAGLAQQAIDQKSPQYLKMVADAASGNADAIKALANQEQLWAQQSTANAIKRHNDEMQYANDIAKMQDELDLLNGKDKNLVATEAQLRDGRNTLAQLEDKLTQAIANNNQIAVNAYTQQIALQNQLIAAKQQQFELDQQVAVLAGQIVGFNNGTAIYANGGTAFNNGQAVSAYQSPSALLAAQQAAAASKGGTTGVTPAAVPSGPFTSLNAPFWGALADGTNKVPADGYAFLHANEEVTPAKYNPAAGGVRPGSNITLNGGITIQIQGGDTSQQTAAEIARQVYPELQKLARRQAA
jgi:hypothetical protein